jgi:SAM-dependent methyltransferase
MSTKPFYDRNAAFVAELSDIEQARIDLETPGTRYYCVADTLADTGSLSALELGFGSIMRARYFASIFGTFEAADISATVLLDGRDAGFAYRDVNLDEAWPFDDASVDVVMAMMVFEHLFDPFHSFAELARILKSDGKAFVNLPNVGSIKCRWDLLRGRIPMTSTADWFELRQWDGGHLHYFTIDEVRRVAALAGLRIRQVYPVGGQLWLKKLRPSLFCHEISYVLEKA